MGLGLVADASELGRPGDHAGDRLVGKPRHALDDLSAARKAWVGLDLGGDRGVELAPLSPRRLGERAQRFGDKGRWLMFALLLDPIFYVFEGGAGLNQPIDLLARAILRLSAGDGKRLCKPGDRLGVDPIVLGEPSGRLGEIADPLRIDNDDVDPGGPQDFRLSCAHSRRSPP